MTAREEQERREGEAIKPVQAICEIINKAFAEPLMPDGFVEAKAHIIDDKPVIYLAIGARDVQFALDGEFLGQGTAYPSEWLDAVEQLHVIWSNFRSEYANLSITSTDS